MNEIEKLKSEHAQALTAYEATVQNLNAKVEALAAENSAQKDVFGPGEAVVNFLAVALRHTNYDNIDLSDVSLAFKMSLPETPDTDAVIADIEARGYANAMSDIIDFIDRRAGLSEMKTQWELSSAIVEYVSELRSGKGE
ncbi:hypothetical protein FEM41_20205 [Jejubacter calystegiae]|uniref:Uncharacterized protein n=1 Tax=Jejubacter calystegiae TaxID=2579935 RepID=A0A4P8YLX6_9ENTR|nr:hypothetical protein [Jejubacter calystegiae]QCT21810.1 hypothetical protein FEM41_20205 [Jejubacter calystegiae]